MTPAPGYRLLTHWFKLLDLVTNQQITGPGAATIICPIPIQCGHQQPYLGGGDAVDKADLLEALLAHGEAHLPAVVHHLVHDGERRARLVHLVLQVHVHVAAEASHLGKP